MDFVEVGFSFWEQIGDREPQCYHIVRLAMPLNLVIDLLRTTDDAVIFNLAEDGPTGKNQPAPWAWKGHGYHHA